VGCCNRRDRRSTNGRGSSYFRLLEALTRATPHTKDTELAPSLCQCSAAGYSRVTFCRKLFSAFDAIPPLGLGTERAASEYSNSTPDVTSA
jgi:hypothetical protein